MAEYASREVLKLLATKNLRGISTSSLVCELQGIGDKLVNLDICPDEVISFSRPQGCSKEEWLDDHHYFLLCSVGAIKQELLRRRQAQYLGYGWPDKEIIQTIKEKLGSNGLTDVIGWYTDVFYYQGKWTFRCMLHGEDKHPSGVIYPNELKWHCYGCNRGGDVFDIVCLFERVELPQAIKKLARYLGIDLKPLKENSKLEITGGVTL